MRIFFVFVPALLGYHMEKDGNGMETKGKGRVYSLFFNRARVVLYLEYDIA